MYYFNRYVSVNYGMSAHGNETILQNLFLTLMSSSSWFNIKMILSCCF